MTGGRGNPTLGSETTEDFEALATSGSRGDSGTRAGLAKPGSGPGSAQSIGNDFWIFDADVQLFYDDDGDGYFYGIDLLFDADTIYSSADVYAAVYLSFEGGPWNEYAVTDDFTIFGPGGWAGQLRLFR